jgi:uncharacterized protein YukE
MSQVHGDPEEVRAFARSLHEFASETQEHLHRLRGQLEHLAYSSWSDSRHTEYSQMFETLTEHFQRLFNDIENEHEPHLERVAHLLDEVLEG